MGPIESDVPRPEPRRGRPSGPLRERMEVMHVGDSFSLDTHYEYEQARSVVAKLKPKKFSVLKMAHQGWRVWRVA
jgi:hypothetical protein